MLSKTALRLIASTITLGTVGSFGHHAYHRNNKSYTTTTVEEKEKENSYKNNYKFCKTAKEKEQFIRDYQYIHMCYDGSNIDDPPVFHVKDSQSDLRPAETIDWEDAGNSLSYSSWYNLCKEQIVLVSSVPEKYQDSRMCYVAVKYNRNQFHNLPEHMFNNKQFIKDVVFNADYGCKLPIHLPNNAVDVDMYIYSAINDPQFYPKISPKKLHEINFWPTISDYYVNGKRPVFKVDRLLYYIPVNCMTDELYEHLLNFHFEKTLWEFKFLTENRINMICNKLKENSELIKYVPKSYLYYVPLKFKTLEVCKIFIDIDSTNVRYTDSDRNKN